MPHSSQQLELRDRLVKVGIKSNHYRLEILSWLRASREHSTAEELYKQIRKKFPRVSFATVYNNLKVFLEKGLVNRFFTPERQARYDFADIPHHHFVCERCGEIEDIPMESIAIRVEKTRGRHFQVTRTETFLYGLCSDCEPAKARD